MLYNLANKDVSKIPILRKSVPKKYLRARYYLNEVEKLNELLEHIAMMNDMERRK